MCWLYSVMKIRVLRRWWRGGFTIRMRMTEMYWAAGSRTTSMMLSSGFWNRCSTHNSYVVIHMSAEASAWWLLTVTGVRFYVRPTSFCCIIFCLLQSQLLFNLFAVVFVRVDWCLNGQPLALTFGCTAVLPPLQTIPQRWPPCWIRSGVRVSAIFEKSSITLIG